MDFWQALITAVYFIFGGVLLFLAYTIVRDHFSIRLNRVAGMMLFFAGLGPIFIALGTIVKPNVSAGAPFEESVIYNLLYIWELFFPSFLLFSLVFPIDRLSSIRFRKLKYLIFFPHLFHLILVIVFNNPEKILKLLDVGSGEGFAALVLKPLSGLMKWMVLGFSLLLGSERTLFSLINLIYVATAVYFILRGKNLITNKQVRRQSNVISWGISIGIGLYTCAFLLPDLLSYELPQGIKTTTAILALVIGGGTVGWSIVRHQFLDVSVIVRQSVVYTISSGILVGLYILLVSQADKVISSFFGTKTTIINIAFIVLALIFFQPINVQLDNLIKKLFMKNKTDYRNIMEQLSRGLISVFDPTQLRAMIEKALISTVLVERVYFVLFDDKLNEYALLPSEDQPNKFVIKRDDLLLGGIGQLDSPSIIDRLSEYRQGSLLAEQLDKRRIQLILPLKDANHLLGFLALSDKGSGYKYNAEDLTMLGVISNQLVTVLTNARLYADSLEKQRLDEEMAMARQIQLDLLPKKPPQGVDFNIHAYSMPSRTIGGDFYDFIQKNDGTFGVVIADASGKGMPAALLVAQIQAMLRSESGNNVSIGKMLHNINKYVTESTSSEKFATLFYGEFNQTSRQFNYSNAGHNYPILVRADGSHELLSAGGLVLGAFAGVEYEEGSVHINENDLLFLYTDGLSEAQNDVDEEYGEGRILDYVVGNRQHGSRHIADGILEDVRLFDVTFPPRDDTTIVILKFEIGRT
jgi:sigma-B regulation protein RsbU (phosphoserine phosphatase)